MLAKEQKGVWDKTLKTGNEHGSVLTKRGRVLYTQEGTARGLDWQCPSSLFSNSTAIHTHPEKGCNGLSIFDILVACYHDVAEEQAITHDGIYSITRPPQGWPDQHRILAIHCDVARDVDFEQGQAYQRGGVNRYELKAKRDEIINQSLANEIGATFQIFPRGVEE